MARNHGGSKDNIESPNYRSKNSVSVFKVVMHLNVIIISWTCVNEFSFDDRSTWSVIRVLLFEVILVTGLIFVDCKACVDECGGNTQERVYWRAGSSFKTPAS